MAAGLCYLAYALNSEMLYNWLIKMTCCNSAQCQLRSNTSAQWKKKGMRFQQEIQRNTVFPHLPANNKAAYLEFSFVELR